MITVNSYGAKNLKGMVVDTTSHSNNWSRGLSPFFLGPIPLYDGTTARNMENAWQGSKVYIEYADEENNPSHAYFDWARRLWNDSRAHRYPMGKGRKPLYSLWDGEQLSYIEARKKIYAPLYAEAVEKTPAYQTLLRLYNAGHTISLIDFDGYDHKRLKMSYEDVINCEDRKMGHAFVLAMMLENQIIF